MDLTEDGLYEASAQFAVPSQLGGSKGSPGGSEGEAYFVEKGIGKDTREAIQNMQTRISRRVHAGQRRAIFIGESLARKKGIATVIDTNARDPQTRLRTDIFLVKGGQAKDILDISYPFERVPVLATVKMHRMVGGSRTTEYRDFLMREFDDVSFPTMPVLQINRDEDGRKKQFRVEGRAIFDKDLKLIGFLNAEQSRYHLWIIGPINRQVITISNPDGGGNLSLNLTKMGRKIDPVIQGNKVKIYITLTGKGEILENGTNVELYKSENLKKIEAALNQDVEKKGLSTIGMVQKQFGTDIFDFGRAIHRKYPYQWRTLRNDWHHVFADTEVIVRSKLNVQRIGRTGGFLELNVGDNEK